LIPVSLNDANSFHLLNRKLDRVRNEPSQKGIVDAAKRTCCFGNRTRKQFISEVLRRTPHSIERIEKHRKYYDLKAARKLREH